LEQRYINISFQKHSFIREHESQFLKANGSTRAYNQRVNQLLRFLGRIHSFSNDVSDILKDFLGLTWKHTNENDIALSCHFLVIENTFNAKFDLKWSQ